MRRIQLFSRIVFTAVVLLFAGAGSGCAHNQRINDPVIVAVPKMAQLSAGQFAQVIERVAIRHHWIVQHPQPGVMIAILQRSRFNVKIQIAYDRGNCKIAYVNSNGLSYNGHTINRRYNRWVRILQREIVHDLTLTPARVSSQHEPAAPLEKPTLVNSGETEAH